MVPEWCEYFGTDEYEKFCAALDGACGCYGAEGRDFDDGTVTMYAGDLPQECVFSLEGLAACCRDSNPEEWDSICFRQVSRWVEGQAHREWLTSAPFAEAEPLLQVWLSDRFRPLFQGGLPGDPRECFSMPITEGLYVSFLAEVPELDDASEMSVLVPNSALAAWGISGDQLLESARDRLRGLPPPIWERDTLQVKGETDITAVEMYYAVAADGVETPVSAWAVLLDEVAPAPLPRGAYVLIPERHTLVLMPDDVTDNFEDRLWALFHVANTCYDNAGHESRVTRQNYTFDPLDRFRATPWPQEWTQEWT